MDIIKGFIIGIGKIIPGVSGAMLAITLGVYEKLIESISNIKTDIIGNIKFLTKIGIGLILAIALTSKMIVKCLNLYYLPTMLLFIGIIIGGIPKIIKNTKLKKLDIILSLIILITLSLTLNNINSINHYQIKYTIIDFIKLIGIGAIDAASSIIPGISGTALLMMLGYYDTIIAMFANILDINYLGKNLFIMIPFLLGFIIGTIQISKLINIIIKKKQNTMNQIIILFMTFTIILLLKDTLSKPFKISELIIGIILLIIGLVISIYLDTKHIKNKKNHIIN